MTKVMNTHELDAAIMGIEGFRLVRVGYLGEPDETEEQHLVPDWFEDATDNSVGAYWLNEAERKVYDAYCEGYTLPTQRPYSPSTNWAHGGPLLDRVSYIFKTNTGWKVTIEVNDNKGFFLNTLDVEAPTILESVCLAIVAKHSKENSY